MNTIITNLLTVFFIILTALPALAFRVGGLKNPARFIVDPALGNYFISNINGKATTRDNNGFISKLDPSGKLLFIIGQGKKNMTLHAPEGLALKGDILYVTDIDSLRWFDKNDGKPLGQIDFTGTGAKQLRALAFDGEGNLYISDVIANTIYKVETENSHKISIFIKDSRLGNPSGMVYDSVRKRLICVAQGTGRIWGISMDGKLAPVVPKVFKNLYGVDWDREGNLLVSDSKEGKIYRIENFSRTKIVRENILAPAGLSFDYARNLILVTSSKGNIAFTIP